MSNEGDLLNYQQKVSVVDCHVFLTDLYFMKTQAAVQSL